jgi:hypothetical protein
MLCIQVYKLTIMYGLLNSNFGFGFTPTFGLDAGFGPPLYGYNRLDTERGDNCPSASGGSGGGSGSDKSGGTAMKTEKGGAPGGRVRVRVRAKGEKRQGGGGPDRGGNAGQSDGFSSFGWWDTFVREKLNLQEQKHGNGDKSASG